MSGGTRISSRIVFYLVAISSSKREKHLVQLYCCIPFVRRAESQVLKKTIASPLALPTFGIWRLSVSPTK